MNKILIIALLVFNIAMAGDYPAHWWKPVPASERHSWEISPDEAGEGEVILSKRNELGILSNFGETPFELDGVYYSSIEGFWQAMKYPDPDLNKDPRWKWNLPFTRLEVQRQSGFVAKESGTVASELMKKNHFPYVSYFGKKFNYKDFDSGSKYHYELIFRATKAKVLSNQNVREVLLKTKGLILKPDHHVKGEVPPSYRYYDILMEIRDSL